jgi:predicted DNA-binding ArsR family transcriptional regulator
MGRDVFIGFSCLDNKSGREDYDSRKTLKKLVDKALIDTNWRLMSDGISYRLGYLNGKIRAYEREEDIKKLVMQTRKLQPKQTTIDTDEEKNTDFIIDHKGNKILL